MKKQKNPQNYRMADLGVTLQHLCSRLQEVRLQVALQVQVRDRILVRHLQQLRQSTIGDDTTLVCGVKARVALHIRRHMLRYLRLRSLGASSHTHERTQLRG